MPTKQVIKVTKAKGRKVQIRLAFTFDKDDPQAERIFRGVGLCLREAFTAAEAVEFMERFEAERKRIAA